MTLVGRGHFEREQLRNVAATVEVVREGSDDEQCGDGIHDAMVAWIVRTTTRAGPALPQRHLPSGK